MRYAIGDPTEAALISLAQKAGLQTEVLGKHYLQLHQYGFDSVRKMMSSVRNLDGETILYVKGSPKVILENSSRIFDGSEVREITQEDRDKILKAIDDFALQAMRNLAFAYKPLDGYKE